MMIGFRHRISRTIVPVLILLLGVAALADAREVPALRGRVNDYAELLDPGAERQIEAVLAELERTDSTQIVVLTIPSLEGDSLEEFSIRVADRWRIGQKGADNGAVLLIALKERKIRIEVGYGLEGRLTDLTTGRIIRDVIAPQFKMGRPREGISNGVEAMIRAVRGEYTAPTSPRGADRPSSPGLLGLLALLFIINLVGRINRFAGAAAGAILAPIAGALFFKLGVIATLLLIPAGMIAGLLISLLGSTLSFGHAMGHRRYGGPFGGGGWGGGFSSGGFSGGGGGFGGGGASGGW